MLTLLVIRNISLYKKTKLNGSKKPFTSPSINLNDLNETEPPTYLYDPIYYFSKYFDDKEFDKIAFLLIYMQLNKIQHDSNLLLRLKLL